MDTLKNKINDIPESKYKDLLIIMAYHRTPETAIGRKELASRLNIDDRTVRLLIAKARKSRFTIISNCHGNGYHLSSDAEEILDFMQRELLSKIIDYRETYSAFGAAVAELESQDKDQMTMQEFIEMVNGAIGCEVE